MMHLLPGDQLWDRYRVDQVTAAGCESAWLTPLQPHPPHPAHPAHAAHLAHPAHPGHPHGNGAAPVSRYLLIPLHASSAHPLAPLLIAAGRMLHLKAPPQRPPARRSRRARGNKLVLIEDGHRPHQTSCSENLPLLGHVEWIGEPGGGGAAIIAAPPAASLYDLIRKIGPFTPAQFLPVFLDLARSLDALATMISAISPRPMASDDLLRNLARLLNPKMLCMRSGDGRVIFNCGQVSDKSSADFAHLPAWSVWSDFLAPELYTELRTSPAALIFGAARVGAFLIGCARTEAVRAIRGSDAALAAVRILPALPDEAEWADIAAWASGKRDPAREYLSCAGSVHIPAEINELLGRCLARRAARRLPNPGKLLPLLKKLGEADWAQIENPCAGCGLNFTPVRGDSGGMVCPGCGREAILPAAAGREGERNPLRAGKRGTSAIYRRSAGLSSTAPAVVAPMGMTLIASGSFLSGERKIPRTLRAFAVDTMPVTEGDYKRFLMEIRAEPRPDGPGSRAPRFDNHPVTGVTWYEANEFAEHYEKRLPTVYEWEKAARGNDGRKFPFGNTYKDGCGRLRSNGGEGERQTMPVGTFPAGASPFGVLDMAGNVLEWTSTARRAGERLFRAVKGACYLDGSAELARCTSVQFIPPETSEAHLGFRCVKDVE